MWHYNKLWFEFWTNIQTEKKNFVKYKKIAYNDYFFTGDDDFLPPNNFLPLIISLINDHSTSFFLTLVLQKISKYSLLISNERGYSFFFFIQYRWWVGMRLCVSHSVPWIELHSQARDTFRASFSCVYSILRIRICIYMM